MIMMPWKPGCKISLYSNLNKSNDYVNGRAYARLKLAFSRIPL